MPNCVASSSISLQFPLFSTTKILKPSYFLYTNSPFILNSSTLTHSSSFNSPLKLKPTSIYALNSPQLHNPEATFDTEKKRGKSRAERFADEIRAIPAENRGKFVHSMIDEHGRCEKLDFVNDLMMGLLIVEEFDIAQNVFDEMLVRGFKPDSWTYSILIRCCCRKDDPEEGKKVLDYMLENRLRPNVVTLTILVNSFCLRGRIGRAFEVVEMMGRIECDPNIQTYNCVLKGLCFVGRVEEAYELLVSLKTKIETGRGVSFLDIYSYTAVMDGFCKVGRSDEAMELLEEAIQMGLEPNVITYNTLFNGYCKEGKPRKGIKLLKQMKSRQCMPDYISYTTLLHGLLKWNKTMAGFWVYNEMVEVGFKPDQRLTNKLLKGLCRESWVEQGLVDNVNRVVDQMKCWGYTVFPDSYCLLSHTFCIAKLTDRAMAVVREMVEAGFFPRMVTVNRIVLGLCEEERVREAMEVLVMVCEVGKIPSKISYNILIDEFNRQGNVLGASNVYGAALKLGVIPHKVPLCVQFK
ncbi:hypothetical protein vseg_012624 [Gypsophila vaccaria]